MTDQFSAQLDQLLHAARERIDHVDSATTYVNALAERYQQLQDALERADACQIQVRARLLELLNSPPPSAQRINGLAEVLELERRRA